MPASIRPVLLFILIGLALVFAIQNVADVEVQFLFWSIALPRAIMILAVLALGMLIGWITHSVHVRRKRQTPTLSTRRDIDS